MVIPILRIFDLEKAKDFYVNFLGFTYDWDHQFEDGLPVYCQVSLNDIILHLSEHHGDCSPGAAIRIQVQNVADYHRSLPKDYRFARPGIEQAPWGTPEMTVTDPFFNRLIFYEAVEL
ncbi:glyoxalase superfamily protein [Sporosarcina sp. YIM B06819]|uniref:glyoxalase superfamily protein n=1 Tax=Sporosarcina sp. YIM B06819 TaxID=3081769 RepID=UPI00298D54EC|nr:glyoxalase superfamily protein [Sporosarcina sp. YIM B06819]